MADVPRTTAQKHVPAINVNSVLNMEDDQSLTIAVHGREDDARKGTLDCNANE